MTDWAYIINRTLENKIAIAENNNQNTLLVTLDVLKEILALLKEHEGKPVIESTNMYTGLPITHCPKCGKSLDRYLYGRRQEGEINFCPYCGQAVKWDA